MRRHVLRAELGVLLLGAVVACRSQPSPAALAEAVETDVAQGRVNEALESVERVLAEEPERADAWRQRCRCLVLLRELDSALEAVERALALDSDDAWSHYERGYLLNEMGRQGEALESLERAIGLAPRFYKAREHRAATLLVLRRPHEAVVEFSAALDVWEAAAPGRAAVLRQRAEAWDALGDSAAAAEDRASADALLDPR